MVKSKNFNNQSHKYYFDNPDIWDSLRNHSIEKEVNFLHHVFLKNKKIRSVLDVGCGTGVHCGLLSKLNYKTFGIDLNRKMIQYAKEKYPDPFFAVGDMRNMDQLFPKKGFDAIICLCTTFAYNITNEEISKTLKNFHTYLNPNGLLIIEVFNPISFLEKNKFGGSFFLEDRKRYNDIGLDIHVVHTVDEKKQIITELKKFFLKSKRRLIKKDKTEFRLWFPQEIKYRLETSGFKVIEQYGRYDKKYLALDKTRLITVAQKNKQ